MNDIIFHKHHIIPKHMGGSDDSSNIIKVNTKMHTFLHKLLWEEYGHWQDEIAWKGLSGLIGKDEIISNVSRMTHLGKPKSPEARKKMKISAIKRCSDPLEKERMKKVAELGKKASLVTITNPNYISPLKGRTTLRKGTKLNSIHCANISKGKKGTKFSKEHRNKMSISGIEAWKKRKGI